MNIIGIIPARYESSRFPGKPLIDIAGKSMIRRVFEQATKSTALNHVVVATDDARILEHVRDFGGEAIMTDQAHQSGTDRCAEVAASYKEFDFAINIQGDEPYINPQQIDLVAQCLRHQNATIATLIKRIDGLDELNNPNTPKVVVDQQGRALYFSRFPIPYLRADNDANPLQTHPYYKHIGIYGYRIDILTALTKLPVSLLEKAEALEQLRWLENGYQIQTAETEVETQAIDTPEDLLKLNNLP